jgi:CRISPR-associated protein Cas2
MNCVVVAYDIPDDRRRERLHKVLLSYGTPVQYSLFECLLEDKELARMKRAVRRVIKPRLDNVRYYYLCATCQGRVETTMGRETTQEEGAIVV